MIALGSHVTFTHRAAVGRRRKKTYVEGQPWGVWELTEPKVSVLSHRNDMPTIMTIVTPITCVEAEELVELDMNKRRRYPVSEESWEKRNKTLFCWSHEGSGVVVGQVRKQYGVTHQGRGGANIYGEGDYDPGYFEAFGQISLYVVKSELNGPQIYVPEAFIHLVHS